jgi:hypothetical protein
MSDASPQKILKELWWKGTLRMRPGSLLYETCVMLPLDWTPKPGYDSCV